MEELGTHVYPENKSCVWGFSSKTCINDPVGRALRPWFAEATPAGALGGPGSPAPCPQAVPAPGALGPQGGFSFSSSFAYETSICHVGSQLYLELQASVPTFTLSCPLPHPSHGDGQ